MTWHYLRIGSCDFCADDFARLHTPNIPNVRAVVPPRFCTRCRRRFEELYAQHGNDALSQMTMEKPHGDR